MTHSDLESRPSLLRHRLEVIGDRDRRECDRERQLALLREVSGAITAFHDEHRASLPPRLRHFLENASLEKTREWIEAEPARLRDLPPERARRFIPHRAKDGPGSRADIGEPLLK